MTDPMKKGWPDPLPNPFTLFGGGAPTAAPATPLAQGLTGGMDLFKKFWGNLPGGTALPGFLVPTLDVAELDKRIADLRAAEQWLDVNVNLLRATIQGLEVQRHTIAAIQSISALGEPVTSAAPSVSSSPIWPPFVAPPVPSPAVQAPAAASEPPSPPPADAQKPADAPESGSTLVGAAASNWLGFMQDQFAKVAQAALAPSAPAAASTAGPRGTRNSAPAARAAASRQKPATQKTASRKASAKKSSPG